MHASDHGPGVGHVVPLRLLFGVLGALLGLTVLTVAITWVDLGPLNLVAALTIAVVKASLVALYFMHLRWDRPINAIVLILALALVMLFVALALLDAAQYHSDVIPGYAPDLGH
jgi:cytochrome c oxidase subunit 4